MKKVFIYSLLLISTVAAFSSFKSNEKISAEKILSKMYKKYAGNWYKSFTFTQTTQNYLKDSLVKTSTWYEAIVFPDYFRITFGDIKDGNAMIQVKDSAYNFRKGKMFRKGPKGEDLTFLLGGMYFVPFENVKEGVKKEGYDLSKAHESEWKGSKVYVIGTETDDEKQSSLWIDRDKLVVVRFIKYDGPNGKEEAVFGDHKQFGKAWSETTCDFYINDKLLQKEVYRDCKADQPVDMKLFDTNNFYKGE